MKTARFYTVKALLRAFSGGYSQIVLNEVLKESCLTDKDRALSANLFYGVMERKMLLERILEERCRKKPDKEVKAILMMAFYELLFMDKIPESATCNESVSLCREFKKTSAAAFVNGILRSFIRDKKALPKPSDFVDSLVLNYSCSRDVAESYIQWLGEEKAEAALKNSLGRAPVFIRANTLKTDLPGLKEILLSEGIESRDTDLENALEIKKGDIAHSRAFIEGLFTVSDKMSQRCAISVGAKKGDRVLDLCAAPGTKSFIMGEMMENEGSVISCDISSGRLKLVDEGKERLGISIISTETNDASIERKEWLCSFDKILCDVPCSGLGVIRRKPELKYRNKEDYENIHLLQFKILETASKYLKAGGTLIYSTCTVNPLENEENIKKFLEIHTDFKPKDLGDGSIIKNDVGEDDSDGFFIAGLEKK